MSDETSAAVEVAHRALLGNGGYRLRLDLEAYAEVIRADERARYAALLEYAAKQIEARASLLMSYRVGRLTKKAEATIDAIENDAPHKLRAAIEGSGGGE